MTIDETLSGYTVYNAARERKMSKEKLPTPSFDHPDLATRGEVMQANTLLSCLRKYGIDGVAGVIHPMNQLILLNYTSWSQPVIVIRS